MPTRPERQDAPNWKKWEGGEVAASGSGPESGLALPFWI